MNKIISRLKIRRIKYDPLIKVVILRDSLLYNFRLYKQSTNKQIAPVLKSNAYGHGLIEVARVLEGEELPFLVVDSFYEAKMLRRAAIQKPILIIGFSDLEQMNYPLKGVTFTLTSLDQIKAISSALTREKYFHLKLDTGMNRQGITKDQLSAAVKLIKLNGKMHISGVCSHLADADNLDKTVSLQQIREWNERVAILKKKLPEIEHFHLSATAGSYYASKTDANVIRLGIGLYGIDPSPHREMDLKHALRLTGTITGVKKIKQGEGVGYNHTFKSRKEMSIATVAAGYFEGVDRRLSNKGVFSVGGQECPIIGRVCMNNTIINASAVDRINVGDVITLISDNPKDKNSLMSIAKLCDTNPHEILVHIPQHLRREIV